jgi:hypothetical protein
MPIKISELPKKDNIEGTDIIPIVDSSLFNYKASVKGIFDYAKKNEDIQNQIKKILLGQNAIKSILNIKQNVDDSAFLRPSNINYPKQRGWLESVTSASINDFAMLEERDFIFCKSRQIFYFLDKKTGTIKYEGYSAVVGGLECSITAEKDVFEKTSVSYPINLARVTRVDFAEKKDGSGAPISGSGYSNVPFHFFAPTATLLLKTKFEAEKVTAFIKTDKSGICKLVYSNGINENKNEGFSLDVPDVLFPGVSQVFINDEILDASLYSYASSSIIFNPEIQNDSIVRIVGDSVNGTFAEFYLKFKGTELVLPTQVVGVEDVKLNKVTKIGVWQGNVEEWSPSVAILDKSVSPAYIHLGYNYPWSLSNDQNARDMTVYAIGQDGTKYSFLIKNFYETNGLELPTSFEDIRKVNLITNTEGVSKIESLDTVVDDKYRIIFTKKITGQLNLVVQHAEYQGLSNGGEIIKIIKEVEGLQASTCGTGELVNTLINSSRSIYNGSEIWKKWYGPQTDWTTIVNDKLNFIYEDYQPGSSERIKNGFTDDELKPLTPKLPLACLWAQAKISDESLINVAFYPYDKTPFNSSTYLSLDDTKKVAESQMYPGKVWQISTDTLNTVRGAKGIYVQGSKPLYFSGDLTAAKFMVSTYKWFVVECEDPGFNEKLEKGKKYLLCVNNINYEKKSISCEITSNGYNVAADLFPCEVD